MFSITLNKNRYLGFKNISLRIYFDKKRIIISNGDELKFTRNSEVPFVSAYLRYRGNKIWNG